MESFEHMGYWWSSDDPESSSFGGKLTFDPETGGVLELLGRFGTTSQRSANKHNQFELIHGHDPESGNSFTLQYCHEAFIRPSLSGNPYRAVSKLRIYYIYKYQANEHFDTSADLVFNQLTVSFTHLNAWMSQFNWEHVGRQIEYIPPDPITISWDDADIVLHSQVSDFDPIPAEISWKEQYFFTIIPKQARSILEYDKTFVYPLRSFLTLATGIACQPLKITGMRSEPPKKTYISNAIAGYSDVQRDWNKLYTFFSFPDVKAEFSDYLKSWLDFSQKVRLAFDLYFSLHYEGSMDASRYFLFMTQALEIYHREMLDENVDKQKMYFKERILEICDSVEAHYSNLFNHLFSCKKTFAENLRVTRNYFAHGRKKEDEEPVSGMALHDYIRIMQILFQVRLLIDMEFPTKQIDKLIGQSHHFKFASKRDRWSSPFF